MADSEAEAAQAREKRRETILLAAGRARRRTLTLALTYLFGFLGPAACFCLYWVLGVDMFGSREVTVHVAAIAALSSLALHVHWRDCPPSFSAFLGGALLSSAIQALLVALFLLPITLLCMLIVVGAVGLIPFGTAWTLYRASREARQAAALLSRRARVAFAACGFALSSSLLLAHPVTQFVAYEIAFERIDELTPDSPERANEVLALIPGLASRPLIDEALACEDDERFRRLSNLCVLRFGFAIDRTWRLDSD
ncbi:MAG: hypothetical protein NTV21_12220 [Planctomycetota bacterium]|nr:hypothetical protein [Planctomycetota bacterium]